MSGPAFGQSNASSDTSDYNSTDFIIRAALSGMQTVSVVKVIAVHGGGVGPTGTVDVQVIVNLMTGSGTPVVHDVIYDVPFTRALIGTFDVDLVHEFFQGFVNHALLTLHVDTLRGVNAHHQCETVFKAFARALRCALERDERAAGAIPSTKGSL